MSVLAILDASAAMNFTLRGWFGRLCASGVSSIQRNILKNTANWFIFGNHLSARTMPRQITEARIKCAAQSYDPLGYAR